MTGRACQKVIIFAQLAVSQLDKEDLYAELSLTLCLLPPCMLLTEVSAGLRASTLTGSGSGSRGPWLAGRRRSSWRHLAT